MTADLIEKYLTEDQRAEIAAEEWRAMCREYFASIDKGAAIGNVAYPIVRQIVVETLGQNADEAIAEKAVEVINGLSSYTVFHEPNAWDRQPSPAWSLLMRVVKDNEDLIRQRVAHHAHNLSKSDVVSIMKSAKLTIQTGGAA